ncbi:MAG: subunit beta of N,N-dimethylformamidase [Acidimicrobiaceae bacterium]|nr:subunit beta of N,N-dimethylformamidase [Acidimicrobiaceae bacterium]
MTTRELGAGPPIGYFDRWTARPGETIELKVSSEIGFDVSIIRVLQADNSALAPGRREYVEEWWPSCRFGAAVQKVAPGSCVLTDLLPALQTAERYAVELMFRPGVFDGGEAQVVAALLAADGRASMELALDGDGGPYLGIGCGLRRRRVRAGPATVLQVGRWYEARLSVDLETRLAQLVVESVLDAPSGRQLLDAELELDETDVVALRGDARPERLMLGAGGDSDVGEPGENPPRVGHFSGKVEAPTVSGSASLAAFGGAFSYSWQLGPEVHNAAVLDDRGQGIVAHLLNAPMSAVTGHAYDGSVVCYAQAPDMYRALALHRDDLEDAGWSTTATLTLPDGLSSGVYAAKLQSTAGSRYVPFFVAPRSGGERPAIAVVLPTFTYLAYANEHVRESLPHFGETPQHPSPQDLEISVHRDFGLSLYDHHDDGTGVCFSSCRRPVLNLDPTYRFWLFDGPVHLGEDLYLLDWLEREGYAFDVLTDHLLHGEGQQALAGYRVVLTGSHPEYVSEQLIDAFEAHVEGGGRLMYLGGNGFYWVTSVHPERPHLIEVRRGNAGGRAWESDPGETHHATTGEQGGLWRHRGRPPNRLLGVGFSAQGADDDAPGYRRVSSEPRWSFVFEGLTDDQAIGESGLLLGGAAGNEVDRADPRCGTPPETVVLATSTGHSDAYQLAHEDLAFTAPDQGGTKQPLVRADLTMTPYVSGGCVFSVGAITWLGALAASSYDNDVARLTANVLRRFLSPAPL